MPQEFQVVQCYSCQTFQVHQVKKALKWNCKLCGEKQSLKKVYGRGSGVDCRKHVQQLNTMRGEMATFKEASSGKFRTCGEDREEFGQYEENDDESRWNNMKPSSSKWSQYTEEKAEIGTRISDSEEDQQITTDRHYFKNQRKAARKRKQEENNTQTNKFTRWDARADGQSTNPEYTAFNTSYSDTIYKGSGPRFSMSRPQETTKGIYRNSKEHVTRPQYINKECYNWDDSKTQTDSLSSSKNSGSKWGHYIENKLEECGLSDSELYGQIEKSNQFTCNNTYCDKESNSQNDLIPEIQSDPKFALDNDNLGNFERSEIEADRTDIIVSSSTRKERNQSRESSYQSKFSTVANKADSKWSKFIMDADNDTFNNSDNANNDNDSNENEKGQVPVLDNANTGNDNGSDSRRAELVQVPAYRDEMLQPLIELDRNQVKMEKNNSDIPTSRVSKPKFQCSETASIKHNFRQKHNTGYFSRPTGNISNSSKENTSLFTTGELNDDDLDL